MLNDRRKNLAYEQLRREQTLSMENYMKREFVVTLLILSSAVACSQGSKDTSSTPATKVGQAVSQTPYNEPLVRRESQFIEVNAKVEAIDYKSRSITLKGPDGKLETFTVDQAVTRFNEIKKGDTVVAQYLQSVAFEVREPTAEEKKNPKMMVEAAGKAPTSSAPAAAAGRTVRAIVTVEGIDRKNETVTVKIPQGQTITVQAKDPKNLDRIKIGDTVAVSYTQAVAIALEPKTKMKQ